MDCLYAKILNICKACHQDSTILEGSLVHLESILYNAFTVLSTRPGRKLSYVSKQGRRREEQWKNERSISNKDFDGI